MRKLTRSPKQKDNLTQQSSKVKFAQLQAKVYFRCDTFLLDKIRNALTSQHLAGNYEYPNVSCFFRSALHAYQRGMPLTYWRELNNPKKEISFRLTEELMTFYNSLPLSSRTEIIERVLGSYFYHTMV